MATNQASDKAEEEFFEPREIVRVFSMSVKAKYGDDSEEESELEKALVSKLDDDEGQRKRRIRQINEYLNSTKSEELIKLGQQRCALEAAMQEFRVRVQKAQPQDVISQKIDSWDDVTAAVERMMSRFKEKQDTSKFRRATKILRTFCNTVNAHSTALKLLPINNDYVTIFYGALATALQASEGYTKVLEALPQALMKINDAVCAIEKRLWLFEDDTMKCYAWRMYSQIFSFLGEVIRWYTKRSIQRLVSSFNENLLAFFDDQVEEIFKLSRLIHDEANLRGQADTQIIRLYQEGMNEKFDRFMIDLRERDRVQRDNLERQYDHFHDTLVERQRSELWSKEVLERALLDIWETIKRRETGDAVTEILEGDVQRGMESPRTPKTTRSVEFDGFRPQAITDASLGGSGRLETTRDSVALLSAHLEDYFDRVKVSIPRTRNDNGVFASSSVASRIKSWVMATESQILYTSGTDPLEEDRQTSDVASQYVLVARKAGIPVCSYSCSLQGINPPADRTRETIELVSLVYSVIRQLVELLPWHAALGTTWSDETPWTALDGTLDTFPQALEILGILLHATEHAIIVIIIDRFDLLDDPSYRSTELALKSLLDLLLRYTNSTKSPILKLWFISGGSSASLFEVLDVNQIAISSTYQRKAGRARLDDELIVL